MAENAFAVKKLINRKQLFNEYKIAQQLLVYRKSEELMSASINHPSIKSFIDNDHIPKIVKTHYKSDDVIVETQIFPEFESCANGILWYFVIKSTTYKGSVVISSYSMQSTKKEININVKLSDNQIAEEVQKSLKIIISKFLL